MFRIIVDGEVVETVMYDDIADVRRYVKMEYFNPDDCAGKVEIERIK